MLNRYKLLKFWAQSFLVGVPKVTVGFRDDDGQIVKVEDFATLNIPRLVRGRPGSWVSESRRRSFLVLFIHTVCLGIGTVRLPELCQSSIGLDC